MPVKNRYTKLAPIIQKGYAIKKRTRSIACDINIKRSSLASKNSMKKNEVRRSDNNT